MYFESFAQLWSMDGHGAYVWGAYAIVWLVLILLLRAPLVRRRQVLARVRARLQIRDAGKGQE
ncbi:MAG: heme exporter protein CcmD [Gammaproteobacteria bacterium]|jgi:heme exporter protein D|nr:heme exporter protein CcmD [Gammaproteobacteria bacterium]MBP6052175.1 heme exporter protein CcmD [Pseudomonadales bacterium]MBK6582237.1 heme exporter protein CcmD [Gammaproteobacteria bacterium]MBK7171342.1 heme exporter protein CcmD [Gammaproteobacteria bacterium]MBK7521490.1 heme exporter protein CcmD [Gammaproteobacteria bacterium]